MAEVTLETIYELLLEIERSMGRLENTMRDLDMALLRVEAGVENWERDAPRRRSRIEAILAGKDPESVGHMPWH